MKIRILLADDHRLMREGIRALLDKQPDMEVVGEAENGLMTLQMAKKISPEIILMDVTMPQMSGIDATSQIKGEFPDIRVVGLSIHSDRQFVLGMLKAGASGYLLKDCSPDELIQAIHTVVANKIYLSPGIAGILLSDFVNSAHYSDSSVFATLTQRECEVLQLISEGKTTREIAYSLYISVKTVETHRMRIMDKLNTHSIAGLTKYAIREGLTSLEEPKVASSAENPH